MSAAVMPCCTCHRTSELSAWPIPRRTSSCGTPLAKSPLAAANLIGTQVPTRPPYLGGSGKFDQAIADFAEVYADQNERD